MMWDYYYGGFWPFHLIGVLVNVALIVIVVAIFARVVRWGVRGGHGRRDAWNWREWRGDSALDLLKERYVKGEISKEEYEEKYRVITNDKPTK